MSVTATTETLSYSHECDGLENATLYNISVSAENGAGEGPSAAAVAATTCTPNIEAQEEGGVRISLSDSCTTRY